MVILKFDTSLIATGSTNSDQLQLPFIGVSGYNCTVDWGDGTSDVITSYNQAETLHTYAVQGEYLVTITGPCPGLSFFSAVDITKLTECIYLDTILAEIPTLDRCFYAATNLRLGGIITGSTPGLISTWYLTVSMVDPPQFLDFDTSSAPTLRNAFSGSAIKKPPNVGTWDVSNANEFQLMFANCSSMSHPPDLSGWDMGNATNMGQMFTGCQFRGPDYDRLLADIAGANPSPTATGPASMFGNLKYTYQGRAARKALTDIGWAIIDGGLDPNWPDPRISMALGNRMAQRGAYV